MELYYEFDQSMLDLNEISNGEDLEFTLQIFNDELKNRLIEIRKYFNTNKILTDVHVYIHPNNRYQIIVRKDFRHEFILQLFKHQLLREIKWV